MGQFFRSFFYTQENDKTKTKKLGEDFEKGSCGRAGEIATGGEVAVPPRALLVV
jgi:hypothetical protein